VADRWTLNRAGIINVYQYDDEVLDFGGGRLLLRGVNGSGKSTAMNMLLPFLLDGDTRRIDAAGEQAGVLSSWMLSGRDDAQPIGYLWVEFARGDDHVTCGCGIKANRASDTVNTWWWVTSRRPGFDLALVDNRHPLSQEALRATLAPEPVFRQEQRNLYRAEVRSRLFGGADIDQHIRLLHIVRNPRVGDRIDVELPGHLYDALPQLSETALLDAAQPLDDLEEHRRNVEELSRTAATLGALGEVYESYARAEMHRRANRAQDLTATAEHARRAAVDGSRRAEAAGVAFSEASRRVRLLDRDQGRLRIELASLRESPAYAEGQQLDELRGRVRELADGVSRAETALAARTRAGAAARLAVTEAAQASASDHQVLSGRLRDLADVSVAAGLPVGVPDVPDLATVALGTDLSEPAEAYPHAELGLRLGETRAAVVHRQGDLVEVRRELSLVDQAEGLLRQAGAALRLAGADVEAKTETFTARRQQFDQVVMAWRNDLEVWGARMDEHLGVNGLPLHPSLDLGADLPDRREQVTASIVAGADAVMDYHERALAELRSTRDIEQIEADELAAEARALDAVVLPPPPALAWQRTDRSAVLAELIDFRDHVSDQDRAGIEAAMEGAGLLGAELSAQGDLVLSDGTLRVRVGAAAPVPLSRLLTVTADLDAAVKAETVERLLASVSVDAGDLGVSTERTVVTVDGRFQVGLLHGRHHKPRAEHIGTSARRAALERQRSELAGRWDEARRLLASTEQRLADAVTQHASARALRADIPAGAAVAAAGVVVGTAREDLERSRKLEVQRAIERDRADEAYAEAVDKSRRLAANLGLPTDPEALTEVDAALREVHQLSHRVGDFIGVMVRGVSQWSAAADRWRQAVGDLDVATHELGAAQADHQPQAARLATIEDTIGVAYAEVLDAIETCASELRGAEAELPGARQAEIDANTEDTRTRARSDELERASQEAAQHCAAAIPSLRQVLDVPGFLAAVTDDEAALRQPVAESVAGLRALVAAIRAHVAPPKRPDVTAETVRQSLRQRRDALAAGWDAEDRQRDEALPVTVEINGPQGRFPLPVAVTVVCTRLQELATLLSSEQDSALRNLLQGLVAREVAEKLHAASDLISRMNRRLDQVTTSHGIGVSLRWRRRDGLDPDLAVMVDLLAKPPDLRTSEADEQLRSSLSSRLDQARRDDPEAPYRDLISHVLDYRSWHEITVLVRRPGRTDERLSRRTNLSEGEKKIVSYLPLFTAVAASCDSLAEATPDSPRFLLLDDAFAKVSEDNHPKLFGLLVELDLDFIATSERLWGTHATVPELAITEVIRDAGLGVIVLEHSHWDGVERMAPS
jgi:uncharacterized protein (TIGR02680 family)